MKLNEENSSLLAEDGLFEGDLKIPESLIRAHYNLSEIHGQELDSNRNRRAAGHNIDLWVNGIVPYIISCAFPSNNQALIRFAMDRWENTTCLQFVPRRSYHSDYIYFQNSNDGCYSYVGRKGGKQIINLERNSKCGSRFGTILHEIAHATGFWHEQARPDRDNYVRIIDENIKSEGERQFMKRNDFDVDYQGTSYDYGSIMHYPERAFVINSCDDCKTIEVSNEEAYEAQGSPKLGQRTGLSSSDIQQMNRLYSCSGPGVCGILTVVVRHGRNLEEASDFGIFRPDPYVEIIAVDNRGIHHRKVTNYESNTRDPDWNEILRFTRSHWQFFRIKVWDSDLGTADDPMSMSETVVAIPGSHTFQKHCDGTSCSGYIIYNYSIV